MATLLVCEPFSHLLNVILLVGSSIGIFGEINVKMFWAIRAVAVRGSTGDDCCNVVLRGVKFWDIKMIPTLAHVLLNEIVKVLMEGDPGFLKFPKRVCRV